MGGDRAMREQMLSRRSLSRKSKSSGEFKLNGRAKIVILSVLGFVVILAVLCAYMTHGWLWSIYVPIYDRFLRTVPVPTGVVEGTETTTLNPELPWGYKQYEVDRPHADSVSFFRDRLPEAGWNLIEHKAWQNELQQGTFLNVDRMLFSRRGKYWLIVGISTTVGVNGSSLEPSHVIIEVYRDKQGATHRY